MSGAVENVIMRRLGMIKAADAELEIRWELVHGDWGIIEVSKDGEVMGFEFVETERSAGDHERLSMYSSTIAAGNYVIVSVPEGSYLHTMTNLARFPPPRPLLFCYDRWGNIKMPRCS